MPVYIRDITTVKDSHGSMPVTTSVPVMTLQLASTDVCAGTVKRGSYMSAIEFIKRVGEKR